MARLDPSRDAEAQARAGLAAFKSSGLHVLEAYISRSVSTAAPRRPSTGAPAHDATGLAAEAPAAGSRVWTGHISADNVGFRLLRRAGWSVGTGLGADEQGRREPIEPVLPKGTRGLGFDSRAAQQQGEQGGGQHRRKRSAAETGAGSPAAQQDGKRCGSGSGGDGRIAALVEAELARESLGDKVARHRQLMSAEEEQRRGRAIDRYLRSAFNDPFDYLHSDNSNPLSRRHKLTENNPLLDPIGD